MLGKTSPDERHAFVKASFVIQNFELGKRVPKSRFLCSDSLKHDVSAILQYWFDFVKHIGLFLYDCREVENIARRKFLAPVP